MIDDEGAASASRVRVWDVPTRLVHWLIVLLRRRVLVDGAKPAAWTGTATAATRCSGL